MKAGKSMRGLHFAERALLDAVSHLMIPLSAVRPAHKKGIFQILRRARGGPFVNGSRTEAESRTRGSTTGRQRRLRNVRKEQSDEGKHTLQASIQPIG